jgi:acyl dehydratase
VAEPLPTWRVRARNTAAHSENRIHDDIVARRYGFPGGLVPGVTVYAYLTHPLVEALGVGWLERGTANVRFVKPVLDGEDVTITGEVTERTAQSTSAIVRATTPSSGECAALTATVPAGRPVPVNLALYREAPLPERRPEATRAAFEAVDVLGTPVTPYDPECAAAYVTSVSDDLGIYRGADARLHPAFFLDQANRSIDGNVALGPWIHVSSTVRHLGPAAVGDTLRTRGRVRSLFEKKGREYVEVDLVILAGPRAVAHVLHTAIYRLPEPVSPGA